MKILISKMDFLNLTNDVLSVDHILKEVSSETCGAVSMFVGTTRDNFEGKKVLTNPSDLYFFKITLCLNLITIKDTLFPQGKMKIRAIKLNIDKSMVELLPF